MRTRIAVVLAAAFTAGMVAPISAEASCGQIIYAERGNFDGNTTVLTGRNTSLDEFMWSASTPDDLIASMIFTAVSQRNRVAVTGNASSCPTTGPNRNMGTILQIRISP